MCYLWSPCRTSYSSKETFFLPWHSSISLTFPVQYLTLWEGDISGVRIPQNCTALRTDTTQNNMRKLRTALKSPENFVNNANRLIPQLSPLRPLPLAHVIVKCPVSCWSFQLISEHCLDQRQISMPDKQLFLISKISGPDFFGTAVQKYDYANHRN